MRIGRLNLHWHSVRHWAAVPLFSAALLIPCFWQSRIQSADLSSHLYNAWLASQIRQGAAPGLWISSQSTNVLFDLMLEWLLVRVGPNLAQRFAVSVSVLVFGWGAICFIFRVAGRNWWLAAPCVAMLAYGFIFHMGFFNFYLSLGGCLWYLAISWGKNWKVHAVAVPLLIMAWIAHPFPVVWVLGTTVYVAVANSVQPRRRPLLLMIGLAALVTARYGLTHRYAYSWSIDQATFITGANQITLFGLKYVLPFTGLLLLWLILLRGLAKRLGMAGLISMIPFQLWLLNATAVVLLPDLLVFPQFGRPFEYIAQRLSLTAGLMLCAVLATLPTARLARIALVSVALFFFGLLYTDYRELNAVEDHLDAVVNRLPAGQRVISSLTSRSLRSLCLHHHLDRACVGPCFSYANYEPSSGQFRVRALSGNGIVLDNPVDVEAVSDGTYVVQPRDFPVSIVYRCGLQLTDFCSRSLQVGDASGEPK